MPLRNRKTKLPKPEALPPPEDKSLLYRFMNYPILKFHWERKYKRYTCPRSHELTKSEIIFQVLLELGILVTAAVGYGNCAAVSQKHLDKGSSIYFGTNLVNAGFGVLHEWRGLVLIYFQFYLFFLSTPFFFWQSLFNKRNERYYYWDKYPENYWLKLDAVQFLTDLVPTLILAKTFLKLKLTGVFFSAILEFCRWRTFINGTVFFCTLLNSA